MTIAGADLRVGNLMTIDPVVIVPDAPASEAERLIKAHRVSRACRSSAITQQWA